MIAPPTAVSAMSPATEEARVTAAGHTVLVADDDHDTREFLTLALEKEGYRVIAAASGQEALELAAAHTPSAIVMDLSMPVMDGVQSSHLIRDQPGLKSVPIIACTGYRAPFEWRPGLFASILLKPVSPSQLLTVLETVLAAPRPR
jgi:CheY-like chemotaxis protein